MKKAYSYLRFSTPEQMQGDSFRRQTEAAREYAEKHGLDLDDGLTFRDLGVSAFRGSNAVDGALAKFIEAVDAGRVKRGSYLLVENLDRLSRDKIMPALNRFSALLEKGVVVVTLSDGKRYDADSLNNLPDLMLSLLTMARAHEESALKSKRVRAAWKQKRKDAGNGKAMTTKCPSWLKPDGKGGFNVIPERADIVRYIFRLAGEGYGQGAIARRLNKEGVKTFNRSNGWHTFYVHTILTSGAALGRMQPKRVDWAGGKKRTVPDGDPIEGYYPAVVSEKEFYRVRRGVSGYTKSGLQNTLAGLVKCVRCGAGMQHAPKHKRTVSYLVCDERHRKRTCDAPYVRYNIVFAALTACLEADDLDVAALLGHAADQRHELRQKLDALDGRIAGTEQGIDNLLNVLERGPSPAIEKRLADHELALADLRVKRDEAERDLKGVANDNSLETMRDLLRGLGDPDPDFNVRLNAALKRLIETVEVGVSDDARRWLDAGIKWADKLTGGKALPTGEHARQYAAILAEATVSIGVRFHVGERHLVIQAHPRKEGRFVAGVVHEDGKGGIKSFRLKISP